MTVTRYLIKTARGYYRAEAHQRPGADPNWTRFPEEAQGWIDLDACYKACRLYTKNTGESAVVVVTLRPPATSFKAVATPA
jgi:hypothetical protein